MAIALADNPFILYFLQILLIERNLRFVFKPLSLMFISKTDKDDMVCSSINEQIFYKARFFKIQEVGIIERSSFVVAYPILSVLFSDDVLGLNLSLGHRDVCPLKLQLSLQSNLVQLFL